MKINKLIKIKRKLRIGFKIILLKILKKGNRKIGIILYLLGLVQVLLMKIKNLLLLFLKKMKIRVKQSQIKR